MAGSATVSPSEVVAKALHPPFSTGSLLVRRCTSVPQSMLVYSTFSPSRLNRSAATWAKVWVVG